MADSRPSLSELHAALPDLAAEARARAVEFESQRRLAAGLHCQAQAAGVNENAVPAESAATALR